MKIYTKGGDKGKTSLFGGSRVEKNNARLEAYGTIDELNSLIGIVQAYAADELTKNLLNTVQNNLFIVGAELATPPDVKSSAIKNISLNDTEEIEKSIDVLDVKLESLKNFILPGGSKSASYLHFARTVCRRAERRIVEIDLIEKVNPNLIVYINRLSDFLFVLARYENHITDTPEIEWKSRG